MRQSSNHGAPFWAEQIHESIHGALCSQRCAGSTVIYDMRHQRADVLSSRACSMTILSERRLRRLSQLLCLISSKFKEWGCTKEQDLELKEAFAVLLAEQFLPFGIAFVPRNGGHTRSPTRANQFRSWKWALDACRMGVTTDSWTSGAGHTYLGITCHWMNANGKLHSMTVDCEAVQALAGQYSWWSAQKIPVWSKLEIGGVVNLVTDYEPRRKWGVWSRKKWGMCGRAARIMDLKNS
jgi:hypothetical protein